MSQKFTTIVAIAGARWDTLSQQSYGEALLYTQLLKENPALAGLTTFSGGEVVRVPVAQNVARSPDVSKLPPWRR